MLLTSCVSWSCAQAQSSAYRFNNWTTEHGLPQNSVLAIRQTRDGYLWLATYNGLVRFDGVKFAVFDKNNTPAFKTSRFHDLFEGANGELLINVEEGGLMRYQAGVFTALSTEQGLPSNTVFNAQGFADGSLLISTTAGAVWWRAGKVTPYEWNSSYKDINVYVGRSGIHWAADPGGLHRREKNGSKADFTLPVDPRFLTNSKMLEDRNGVLWVAPPRHGLFRVKNGVVTNYTEKLKQPSPLHIMKMLEDTDGSLWLATINGGLIHFSNDATETFTTFTTADGLSSNGIRGLFQDQEGTLWIGADGGGLNRMSRQFFSSYSETQGLAGNVAHAVYADHAGNIWVATHNGLSRISNGVITNFSRTDKPGGLPLRGLQSIGEDRQGRLWLGGFDGACSFKDGIFSPAIRDVNGRAVNVWAIHEDRQGTLWLGTHFGLMKLKDDQIQTIYTTADGLPNDTIRAVHEDRQGALWLGTEGGLVKFQDGRFTTFTTKEGLVNNRIWSIYEDAEGVFWLGTFDSGLSRFKDGRFTSYTTAHGLYNNGVFQILEDNRGYLWMSCYRGLYRVSKQQLHDFAEGRIAVVASTAYSKNDGMLSSDCNGGRQPSGIKTQDGRLWFTTLKGVVIVNTHEMLTDSRPPAVLIESATLDHQLVALNTAEDKLLRVEPGQMNLEIAFTALSFFKGEQTRFRYQLLGQDANWIEGDTRRTANYSYLRPGEYSFKVIAANSDGVWNQTGAQLRIVVLPAFYQTWWFRGLAVIGLAALIGGLFKWRLVQADRVRKAQEAFLRRLIDSQEQERKRLAAELHDGVGQDLLVIKNWIGYGLATLQAENPAHQTLDEISAATANAIESCREIAYNLRPHQMDYVGLTEALRTMLQKVAQAAGLRLEMHLDDLTGALPKASEINLFRIAQEALNNIVKHAHASTVTVKAQRDYGQPARLLFELRDDGRGFDVTQVQRGMGLSAIAERAQMLGGSALIDSAPGRGTTLSIKVNLSPDKMSDSDE